MLLLSESDLLIHLPYVIQTLVPMLLLSESDFLIPLPYVVQTLVLMVLLNVASLCSF